jgi:hypothetical protein
MLSGLANKVPFRVRLNTIVNDSDYDYLYETGGLRADVPLSPTGVGIDRLGIFDKKYGYFSTDDSAVDGKALMVYRGPGPLDACAMYCPLVPFYIDDEVTVAGTGQKTRMFMSRFALPKVIGSYVGLMNYIAP